MGGGSHRVIGILAVNTFAIARHRSLDALLAGT